MVTGERLTRRAISFCVMSGPMACLSIASVCFNGDGFIFGIPYTQYTYVSTIARIRIACMLSRT